MHTSTVKASTCSHSIGSEQADYEILLGMASTKPPAASEGSPPFSQKIVGDDEVSWFLSQNMKITARVGLLSGKLSGPQRRFERLYVCIRLGVAVLLLVAFGLGVVEKVKLHLKAPVLPTASSAPDRGGHDTTFKVYNENDFKTLGLARTTVGNVSSNGSPSVASLGATAFSLTSADATATTSTPDAAIAMPFFIQRELAKVHTTIIFYAIGDAPYNSRQADELKLQLRRLPRDADFVIHIGDIRNPRRSDICRQNEFNKVARILNQSHAPVLIIPGDNEYNDCLNFEEAYSMWLDQFAYFERKHWNNRPMQVHRMKRRPENFFFELRQVLFIGLNIVGGEPSADDNGEEWTTRLNMEYHWTKNTVHRYVNNKTKGTGALPRVVIFGHAKPRKHHRDFFDRLVNFMEKELNGEVPFLYLHGDDHMWDYDVSFMGQPNFMRIMVAGGTTEAPLRIQVNTDSGGKRLLDTFEYERDSYKWRQDN